MYQNFYNLSHRPFDLTPTPRHLYLGETHKEALALLTYGVTEQKGFVLLTGEVGTGKTTMVKSLLANLDDTVRCVYISNPRLSPTEFMEYLSLSIFDNGKPLASKAQFLVRFEKFLKESEGTRQNFVLIIDEAQNISDDMLEDIRLLSNMEDGDRNLISIFLVGQPELNQKLSQSQCRPVYQRISMRYHIQALNKDDTREYVNTRLETAGSERAVGLFTPGALTALHKYSGGYPRMINVLADNALLLGYSQGSEKITASMVKEAYKDTQIDEQATGQTEKPNRKAFFMNLTAAIIAALLALSAIGLSYTPTGKRLLNQGINWLFSEEQAVRQSIDKEGLER